MSEPIDRREGLRRGALAALALSLGITDESLAQGAMEAARFEIKWYAGDRLIESMHLGDRASNYLTRRPTVVQAKWYDLEKSEREPLSVLGFTESRQIKVEDIWAQPSRGETG